MRCRWETPGVIGLRRGHAGITFPFEDCVGTDANHCFRGGGWRAWEVLHVFRTSMPGLMQTQRNLAKQSDSPKVFMLCLAGKVVSQEC